MSQEQSRESNPYTHTHAHTTVRIRAGFVFKLDTTSLQQLDTTLKWIPSEWLGRCQDGGFDEDIFHLIEGVTCGMLSGVVQWRELLGMIWQPLGLTSCHCWCAQTSCLRLWNYSLSVPFQRFKVSLVCVGHRRPVALSVEKVQLGVVFECLR